MLSRLQSSLWFFCASLWEETSELKKRSWHKGLSLRSASHTFYNYGLGITVFPKRVPEARPSEPPEKGSIVFRKAALPHRKGCSVLQSSCQLGRWRRKYQRLLVRIFTGRLSHPWSQTRRARCSGQLRKPCLLEGFSLWEKKGPMVT